MYTVAVELCSAVLAVYVVFVDGVNPLLRDDGLNADDFDEVVFDDPRVDGAKGLLEPDVVYVEGLLELLDPLERDEPEKLDEREGELKLLLRLGLLKLLLRPELNDPPPLANTLNETNNRIARTIFLTDHFPRSF